MNLLWPAYASDAAMVPRAMRTSTAVGAGRGARRRRRRLGQLMHASLRGDSAASLRPSSMSNDADCVFLPRCRPCSLPTGLPLLSQLEPGSHRSRAQRDHRSIAPRRHSRGLSSLEALLTASSPTSANKARAESRFTRLSRARVPSRKQASQGRQITSPKTRGGQQRTSPREKHEDYDLTRSATERARPAGRAPSPRKRVTGPTRSRAPPRTSSRAARATAS